MNEARRGIGDERNGPVAHDLATGLAEIFDRRLAIDPRQPKSRQPTLVIPNVKLRVRPAATA